MNKLFHIMLIVLLIAVMLTGCHSATTNCIVEENGTSYLVIPDALQAEVEKINEQILPMVYFDSVPEMMNRIKRADFSELEVSIVAAMPKDEENRIILFDTSHVYSPVYPQEFDRYVVYWYGKYYRFRLYYSNSEEYANLRLYRIDESNSDGYSIDDFLDTDRMTILSRSHTEDRDAEIVQYINNINNSGEECKKIFYTIQANDGIAYVLETYYFSESESVPKEVDIYGQYSGQPYQVHLFDLEERPSIEWLAQFGLQEYVETEVS